MDKPCLIRRIKRLRFFAFGAFLGTLPIWINRGWQIYIQRTLLMFLFMASFYLAVVIIVDKWQGTDDWDV